MQYHKILRMIGLVCLFALLLSLSVVTAQDTMVINLELVTFVEDGAAEQDVFIMGEDGMAYRIPLDTPLSMLSEPLYTVANADDITFDPFQVSDNPLGPYEIGEPLNMTMKEWLAARGEGTYTLNGDTATVDLEFVGLVPDGVYTLWCFELTFPPEFEARPAACGADDGSENTFIANEHGEMSIQMSFPALSFPTETGISGLAIAWHSDGQTYGAEPGPFGTKTFTHLGAVLVPPTE